MDSTDLTKGTKWNQIWNHTDLLRRKPEPNTFRDPEIGRLDLKRKMRKMQRAGLRREWTVAQCRGQLDYPWTSPQRPDESDTVLHGLPTDNPPAHSDLRRRIFCFSFFFFACRPSACRLPNNPHPRPSGDGAKRQAKDLGEIKIIVVAVNRCGQVRKRWASPATWRPASPFGDWLVHGLGSCPQQRNAWARDSFQDELDHRTPNHAC